MLSSTSSVDDQADAVSMPRYARPLYCTPPSSGPAAGYRAMTESWGPGEVEGRVSRRGAFDWNEWRARSQGDHVEDHDGALQMGRPPPTTGPTGFRPVNLIDGSRSETTTGPGARPVTPRKWVRTETTSKTKSSYQAEPHGQGDEPVLLGFTRRGA